MNSTLTPPKNLQLATLPSWKVHIYLNIDMWKFESSQKDEGRVQAADSSKGSGYGTTHGCSNL